MTQIKPIAMKCSEEQFNAINHKLSNFNTEECCSWQPYDYLVNNFNGKLGRIGNARADRKDGYNRTVFEEWDEQTFLEYCGIVSKELRMVTTPDIGAKVIRGRDWEWGDQDRGSVYGVIVWQKRDGWVRVEWKNKNNNVICGNSYRIGTDGYYDLYYYPEFILPEKWFVEITDQNKHVLLEWVRKQHKYDRHWEHAFRAGNFALSKHPSDNSYLYIGTVNNFKREHGEYLQITFEQFQQHVLTQEPIKQEQMAKYTNYTVNATELFKIHKVACPTWKSRILDYLKRTDEQQQVTFTEEEIDAMFTAASTNQKPVLIEIFGEAKPTYTPKPGEMVWCWDRANKVITAGVYLQRDGSDIPYKVGNTWWHHVAPFNNGVLPEEWAAKFLVQQNEICI